MSDETPDPKAPKLSSKELAKKFRKAAYARAKEQRKNDPKFQALKEAMKLRQKEFSKAARERKRASSALAKTKRT